MSIQLADRSIKYPHWGLRKSIGKSRQIHLPRQFYNFRDGRRRASPDYFRTALPRDGKGCDRRTRGKIEFKVNTVNHDGKWTKEEEEDSNNALAVSFYPRTEPMEPLEWKALDNRLKQSSVEPPKLELKELHKHLDYAFLQENNQLPVVISSALSTDEKTRLLEVLRNHKGEIAWSIANIKGIDSSFCTRKILMEDEFKPSVQPQRRVNPNIKEVVKKEVIKLLDVGLIYPISDSPWVSLVQVISKKGGMIVVKNDKDELIPQRTFTRWRVRIDCRKLNNATWKDHFPLPFIDQMLERLAGHEYYCFLDGFSGYFQIPISFEDQEKTTFQRCMTAIFHELIEDSMELFMDDFSVFGSSFDHCLKNLEKMLKRREETNLVLNWKKCHFMVKEGIVLTIRSSVEDLVPTPSESADLSDGESECDVPINDDSSESHFTTFI
ncbi:hypothetical protein Tco_0032518 [Tanacetum coccineum]